MTLRNTVFSLQKMGNIVITKLICGGVTWGKRNDTVFLLYQVVCMERTAYIAHCTAQSTLPRHQYKPSNCVIKINFTTIFHHAFNTCKAYIYSSCLSCT